MANLNKVMIIGNLTRDPELRHTPKGTAVAELGIAINRVWRDEQGQKQEDTTFVDVTLWGRQAEVAQQYLSKGSPCYIEGRLTLDTWDDKTTGQKRSKLKVVGETLQLLGAGIRGGQSSSAPASAPPANPEPSYLSDSLDADIPF
jgi:single-strand DNA-binding protein